jgi:hypothetical protein
MKKSIYFFSTIFLFLISCGTPLDVIPTEKTFVSVVYAYSVSNTVGEVSVALSENSSNAEEVGIVWATKSKPTIADNRQSVNGGNNGQTYSLKINNLTSGTTYYIKAYYISQGVITYSLEELVFTQNYDPNWISLPSPVISSGRYMLSSRESFSGGGGGVLYYSVDKNTNTSKSNFFYPSIDEWDISNFNSDVNKETPMRFEPFRANYNLKTERPLPVVLMGGGYYKQANGKKFFLKDFRIEGIIGFTFQPSYPGIDATTSSFGIDGNGYILENTQKGKLWRFTTATFQWEALNTVPITKEAKFVSFDIGERAFILPESNNWKDDLDPLYEYLPTNQWKVITTFRGENRRRGVSFVYNNKLYYGAGQSIKTRKGLRDIWEYNPTTDIWKQIATYPGSGTVNLVPLMVQNVLYIGFGQQVIPNENQAETFNDVSDFWRFTIK